MFKIIQPLILALVIATSLPAFATPFTGVDGMLAPTSDYTLPFRADGIFDFSAINIGPGIALHFDAGMTNVTLQSLGNIVIDGKIDTTGIAYLTLEALGQTTLNSSIDTSYCVITPGISCFLPIGISGGSGDSEINIPPLPPLVYNPPDISIVNSIPEPGILYLMSLVLPIMIFHRHRHRK